MFVALHVNLYACFVAVCTRQPACTRNPALHLITLHSRSILLHPATNMYVTSPSILSPLCRPVTTASASASDCLWWLTITQPPFLLVCPSCYKSLMIMCVFFHECVCVCILCVIACMHTTQDGFHYPQLRGGLTKLDEKTDYEERNIHFHYIKMNLGNT